MTAAEHEANINQIKADRHETAIRLANDMYALLDTTSHDPRNSKEYKMDALESYYYRNGPEGQITAATWDEMFSHYTPYTGTY